MGAMAGGGVSLGSLWVEINAKVDEAVRELQKFGKDAGKVVDEQTKKWEGFAKIGDKMKGAGAAMTAAFTLPMAGLAAASVKAAGDFESSMNKIQALADVSAADLKQLQEAALKWGADTQFSAQQVAEGMTELAAKGLNTTQILATMPGILSLAAAGQLSIAEASKIASATLSQFGMDVSQAGRVADVLAQAANMSAASVGDLGQAMNYVGPVAKAAGISLEETSAALAILSNGGREATQAGTDLRGIMGQLLDPSKRAAETLERLGVSAKDSGGNLRPLNDIFLDLQKSGASTADMFVIFGNEGATAASILTAKAGPALAKMTQEMQNSEGAAKKAADTLNKGFMFQLEQLKGLLETAGIAIGQVLIPPLLELLKHLTKLLNDVVLPLIAKFRELPEPVKQAALAFGAIVAALGPLLFIGGQAAGALTNIAGLAKLAGIALGPAGLTGAGTALAGLLPILTPLLIAAGAAIAAWAIYKAVTEIQNLNSELDRLYALQAQGVRASKEQAQEIGVLEAALRRQGITVESMGKSTEQYIAAMREALKNTGQFGEQAQITAGMAEHLKAQLFGVKEGAKGAGGGMKEGADEAQKLSEEVKKQEEAYKKILRAYQNGKASLDDVTAAQIRLQQAQDRADPQRVAQRFAQAQREMTDRHDDMVKSVLEGARRLKDMDEDLAASTQNLAMVFARAHSDMRQAATQTIEVVKPAMDRLPPAIRDAIKANDELTEAFKRQGITSAAALKTQADQAAADYERIRASGQASARDLGLAWVAAEEKRIEAAKAAGIEVPKAHLDALNQMKKDLDLKLPEQKSAWDGFGKDVSTAITNFAQDMTKSLWEGGASWGEKGKELLKGLGQAVTNAFIEPATKAISGFISGAIKDLLGGEGLGGVFDSLSKLGDKIMDIFGPKGGVGGSGIESIAGGAPSVGGGAGGAGGAAAGAGLAGIVGAVGSVVSAISGVIGNFQMAKMEKTLNAIEESTRYMKIGLVTQGDSLLNDSHKIRNTLSNMEGNFWGITVSYYQDWSMKFDDMTSKLGSIVSKADKLDKLDDLAGPLAALVNSAWFAENYLLEIRDNAWNEVIRADARHTEILGALNRQITMNVQGSDPNLIAERLAQKLRLQGGAA